MKFKLNVETHKRDLNLSREYELYILLNNKVSATKDHDKNYTKSDLPSFAIFCIQYVHLEKLKFRFQ